MTIDMASDLFGVSLSRCAYGILLPQVDMNDRLVARNLFPQNVAEIS